jgi:hypothetical protein
MSENTTDRLEDSGTDVQLSQALSHLQFTSSTDVDPMCQVSGEAITEGQSVTLYLSRAAGRTGYKIGQCRCANHNDDMSTLFTLGVRELIVDGRIGQCQDPATEKTWAVLLAPSIRLISAADTKSGRRPIDDSQRPCHTDDQQNDASTHEAAPTQAYDTDLSRYHNTPTVQPRGGRQ